MNCGRIAVKNNSAFGFAACKTNPSRSIRQPPRDSLTASGRDKIEDLRKKLARPRYTRYAAPAHLIKKKRRYEATITAPRLVADNAKYIVLAERIPQLAQTDFFGPRRIAWERTY